MTRSSTYTKEALVQAALQVCRNEGMENLTVRRIAKEAGCTTQPVVYHFENLQTLKDAVFNAADALFEETLMHITGRYADPMLEIGMNYIRFAMEEPHLFRLLFQSQYYSAASLRDLVSSPALDPILNILQEAEGFEREQAVDLFAILFISVHGIASLASANTLEDESYYEHLLSLAYTSVSQQLHQSSSIPSHPAH